MEDIMAEPGILRFCGWLIGVTVVKIYLTLTIKKTSPLQGREFYG